MAKQMGAPRSWNQTRSGKLPGFQARALPVQAKAKLSEANLGCSFVTRQAPKSMCFIIKDHFDHGFDGKAYLEFKSILGCSFMAGQDP